MSLEQGSRLGPYEIDSQAGAGGMGEVYKATDTRLHRTVAIKVLPGNVAGATEFRERFQREAKAISSLNHPNICTLYDVGHDNGIDYLVMEYLEGETLDQRLKRGKLDQSEALEIATQITSALQTAHRRGLVHRDIKPGNIILTKSGAKLLDFGLAKLQTNIVTDMGGDTVATPVTGAGAIVGTLQYMSPEQMEGKDADSRSDIFSLGATIYEMLTGERAFSGDSQASLVGSVMRQVPRDISEIRPGCPKTLDRIINKCLEKDPDERWQTAKDLHDELIWAESIDLDTGSSSAGSSRMRWQLRAAFVLVVIVAAISTYLWIKVENEKERVELAKQEAIKGQKFLSDVLTSSVPHGFGDETTVLDIIDAAREKLDGAFPDEPELEAELRQSIGYAYDNLGHHKEAKQELNRAAILYEQNFGVTDDRTLDLLSDLNMISRFLGDNQACVEITSKQEKAIKQRFGEMSREANLARQSSAVALERAGRVNEAAAKAEKAWRGFQAEGTDTTEILWSKSQFAWLQLRSGRTQSAAELAAEVFSKSKAVFGESGPETNDARSLLAATFITQGKIDSAKALYGYRIVPDTFGIEHVFQGKFDLNTNHFQLLVFFEEWCPFSRLAMIQLARVDRQYRQFGITTCGMTRVNRSATDEKVENYLKELGIDFTVVKENGRSWNYFSCAGTPSIRILADGYLIWEKGSYTGDAIAVPLLEGMVLAAQDNQPSKSRLN